VQLESHREFFWALKKELKRKQDVICPDDAVQIGSKGELG